MNFTAIDIGGTFIKYANMDRNASILEKGKISTPQNWESFYETLLFLAKKYPRQQGICISCPGLIDTKSGICYHGGSLHFLHEKNLKKLLENSLGIQTEIENDAKCAGLAEATLGNASHVQDSIVIVLGTGIGGALIKNKRVLHGKHLMAGEFSYIIPSPSAVCEIAPALSPLLFREVSAKAIAEKVRLRKQLTSQTVTGELVYQWAQEGDSVSRKVLSEFYISLAIQLANLQHIFDPEIICIGGGISRAPHILEDIRIAVDNVYKSYSLKMEKPQIAACKFYNDSNMIGALCHFLQQPPLQS
ncbi:MAG: ROK family protein [Eubacteriales bacterium]|nr:ROK family protein [Eubacteriales bacterium]